MNPYALFIVLVLAVQGSAQTLKLDSDVNPAGPGSLQANWSVTRDGSPLLSWIETLKDGSTRCAIPFGAARNGRSLRR